MKYKEYQHVCRLGTSDTEGLLDGTCFIEPKIDGTNGVLFLNDKGKVSAGSRRRELDSHNDNRNFYKKFTKDRRFRKFFKDYPHYILYGEYLVPNTLRTYNDDAWDEFYVFDIMTFDLENSDKLVYVNPWYFSEILDSYDIKYIPVIAIENNPTEEKLINIMNDNTWMIQEGMGIGEGIVIKNYNYVNPYGRIIWGKMIADEYRQTKKDNRKRKTEQNEPDDSLSIEEKIVEKYLTDFTIEKEYQKMIHSNDYDPKKATARMINTLYHTICEEDIWDMVKTFNNPTVNFRELRSAIVRELKEEKPELFSRK